MNSLLLGNLNREFKQFIQNIVDYPKDKIV